MVNRMDNMRILALNGPIQQQQQQQQQRYIHPHPDYDNASSCNKKKRVGKACDNCRIKKTKCNGKKPCDKCLLDNRICTFSERRRDKEKHYPAGYLELLETRSQLLTRSLQKLVELSIDGTDMLKFFTKKYPVVEINPITGSPTVSINKAIDALVTHEGLLNGEPVEWDEGTRIAAGFDQRDSKKAASAIKAFAKHSTGKAGSLNELSSPRQQQQQPRQYDLPKPKVKKEPLDTLFSKPNSPEAATTKSSNEIEIEIENDNDNENDNDDDNSDSKNIDGLKLEENDFNFSLPLTESNTFTSLSPISSNSDHSIPAFFQLSNAIAVSGQDPQLPINGPELANGDVFDLNVNQRDFMITGDSTISTDHTAAANNNDNDNNNDNSLTLDSGTGSKILSAALNRNLSMGDFENYSPSTSSEFNSNNNSNSLFSNIGNNRSLNSLSLRSNTMTQVNSANSCLFFDDKKKPELKAVTNASGVAGNTVWGFLPDNYNSSGQKPFSPVDSFAPNNSFPGSFNTGFNGNGNGNNNNNNNININDINSNVIFPRNFTAELSSPVGSPVLSSPALTAVPNDLPLAANGSNSNANSSGAGNSSSAGNATKLTRKTSDGHISKPSHHYHPHAHAHSHSHGLGLGHGHGHSHGHNASKLANLYLNLANATPAATKRSSTFPIAAASSGGGSNAGTPEDTSLDLFQSNSNGLANSAANGFVDASVNEKDKDVESLFKRLSADLTSFGIGNGNASINGKADNGDFFLRNGAAGVGSAGGIADELLGFPDF